MHSIPQIENSSIKTNKNEIRFERENTLQKLDIEFQRAQEIDGDTTGIVARKQHLRDLPKKCDSASTIHDLLNIWDSYFQLTAGGWYKKTETP